MLVLKEVKRKKKNEQTSNKKQRKEKRKQTDAKKKQKKKDGKEKKRKKREKKIVSRALIHITSISLCHLILVWLKKGFKIDYNCERLVCNDKGLF